MNCDLDRLFGPLARAIPTSPNESFVFSSETLPVPPAHMVTERLYIQKGGHAYESRFYTDALWFFAHKRTYRELALLILAIVFHPEPIRVQLELTHPASEIKNIFIEFDYQNTSAFVSSYITRPYRFEYFPDKTDRHPWVGLPIDRFDLPSFWLTNKEDNIGRQEEWNNRDTIIGFGNDRASVMLAQFLLDASRPQNKLNEYEFESDAGWRSLGRWSAEARLWLPGSAAWNPDEW